MFQELDSDRLADIVSSTDKVVVQFSAGWCGNCRMMKPKFKKMARENEDMEFYVVDAEKFPESRKLAKVDNLPTFASFKGGELMGQVQTNKADKLKELVDEIAAN
ncbi:MAG: thioredoxin family protein [Vicingaceae bacterium]